MTPRLFHKRIAALKKTLLEIAGWRHASGWRHAYEEDGITTDYLAELASNALDVDRVVARPKKKTTRRRNRHYG